MMPIDTNLLRSPALHQRPMTDHERQTEATLKKTRAARLSRLLHRLTAWRRDLRVRQLSPRV